MLPDPQLAQALATVQRVSLHGPWYRTLAFDHLQGPPRGRPSGSPVEPLWPGGPRLRGARFTPKETPATPVLVANRSFDSLYVASDVDTALLEVTGVLRPPGSPLPLIFEPQVVMTVDGVLTDVIDLTDRVVQRALGTSRQELTGDWALQQADYLLGQASMPDTQRVGQQAEQIRTIVGLKFPSSKNVRGFGVVVFTSRLAGGASFVELFNKPSRGLQQRLP